MSAYVGLRRVKFSSNVHLCKDKTTKVGFPCFPAEPAQNGKYIAMRFGEQTLCFSFSTLASSSFSSRPALRIP